MDPGASDPPTTDDERDGPNCLFPTYYGIDGNVWEMKAPKSSNIGTIRRNLRRSMELSRNIIFDFRRMNGMFDAAIERKLRKWAHKFMTLGHIIIVNHHADIIDICRQLGTHEVIDNARTVCILPSTGVLAYLGGPAHAVSSFLFFACIPCYTSGAPPAGERPHHRQKVTY